MKCKSSPEIIDKNSGHSSRMNVWNCGTDQFKESCPCRIRLSTLSLVVSNFFVSGIRLLALDGGIKKLASSCNGGRESFISCVTWGMVLLLLVEEGFSSVPSVSKPEGSVGRDARLPVAFVVAFFCRYDFPFFNSIVMTSGMVGSLSIAWGIIFMIKISRSLVRLL